MTIWICGDSTAACYDASKTRMVGWGQVLPELLPGVSIENRAFAGRSTKSFLAEGRLKAFEAMIQPGDIMLIQFGHNDWGDKPERHTEAFGDFQENLCTFMNVAHEHGAIPILMTSSCVRSFQDGQLQASLGAYPEAVRQLAKAQNAYLIDLYTASFETVSTLGDEASKALYMHIPAGVDPRHPDGSCDDTHTCREGAQCYANVVAEQLKAWKLV